jgi:hypothetical protein
VPTHCDALNSKLSPSGGGPRRPGGRTRRDELAAGEPRGRLVEVQTSSAAGQWRARVGPTAGQETVSVRCRAPPPAKRQCAGEPVADQWLGSAGAPWSERGVAQVRSATRVAMAGGWDLGRRTGSQARNREAVGGGHGSWRGSSKRTYQWHPEPGRSGPTPSLPRSSSPRVAAVRTSPV